MPTVSNMILSELAPLVSAQHGVFYSMTQSSNGDAPVLEFQAGYGYEERRHLSSSFRLGEGLVGQCAKEAKRILITEVPNDYVKISSGLGSSPPLNIIVLPVLFEGSVRAVVELASFSPFSATHQTFLDQLTESIGVVLNTVEANTVTANLLTQSQSQAEELRLQQEELRESNEDLARQAKRLEDQNIDAKRRSQEVEQAKRLVEEKAEQLAVSSTYKSEFIANMSHELRTPLNSLLMLAEQLQDNPGNNMSETQVEYASVILSSGKDLMKLLNSILDLAKVESGTMTLESTDLSVRRITNDLLREFGPVAREQGLIFSTEVAKDCPENIVTDPQRLGQILRNLLSNAFKFTVHGQVRIEVRPVADTWNDEGESHNEVTGGVVFSVSDTGVGIEANELHRIFEAFAQGDGSTSRLYGGTGLGLSISETLVGLLGGEITVKSTPGQGSTFDVHLPLVMPRSAGSRGNVDDRAPLLNGEKPPIAVSFSPVVEPKPEARLDPRHNGGSRPPVLDYHPFAGMTILVVDDDFRNVFALTALLERGHAEVAAAESGGSAIAILEELSSIDLVLMDIMMPGMDGYTTIRTIRNAERFADLPIIAVTGKVLAGERQRCIEAGANDYVSKPVNSAELLATIGRWIPMPIDNAS